MTSANKKTVVHWLFKEAPALEDHYLCDVPRAAIDAENSVVLRPVIRQQRGLRECERCSAIGGELGIR